MKKMFDFSWTKKGLAESYGEKNRKRKSFCFYFCEKQSNVNFEFRSTGFDLISLSFRLSNEKVEKVCNQNIEAETWVPET